MVMADPHVITALREKRALVSGLIERLERKLEQHRADLTHIDGVLRLFQPDRDPGDIKPKRNELSRICSDALRDANGELLTTEAIAARVINAKGFDGGDRAMQKAIRDQVLTVMRSFRKQSIVEQIGLGRGPS